MIGKDTELIKIFANHISNKWLVLGLYNKFSKFNNKRKHPIKKWGKDLSRNFNREDVQMVSKHIERCSVSLVIRKMKIETEIRYHYVPIWMSNPGPRITQEMTMPQWPSVGEIGNNLQNRLAVS